MTIRPMAPRRRTGSFAPPPPAPAKPAELELGCLVDAHLDAHVLAASSLRASSGLLARWGEVLADRLLAGHRLLAAGNGGSAAEAQHLTAELVGRFDGERRAFSAISLHAESSALTAISNDYGYDDVFARQVQAHGRPGDILMLFSTSGRSVNLLRAAQAGRQARLTSWALTGSSPNPLAHLADETLAVDGPAASAQECHLIALHALCRAFDARVAWHAAGQGPGQTRPVRRGDRA
ncbi:D-sedoheptulose 7-phosphate isomerase [Propionibacterium cyclohexanicum]|uniref:D-sedoheptulose 7-phosphate isomerase n=1 Tax=Propionibacterium cyclohexanicum TaxID=64702 RepID=A0A1H9SJ77_9ACTN|nr:SIS domain-containing protein [Propionibacterium cyclohexanicum]SER84299.1 D-sedoheptulose 7-phosphate isomerase [Propionibacterium cyclohexanicum]